MTDHYCGSCDRQYDSKAAADACATEDANEDQRQRIRRSTN